MLSGISSNFTFLVQITPKSTWPFLLSGSIKQILVEHGGVGGDAIEWHSPSKATGLLSKFQNVFHVVL